MALSSLEVVASVVGSELPLSQTPDQERERERERDSTLRPLSYYFHRLLYISLVEVSFLHGSFFHLHTRLHTLPYTQWGSRRGLDW